MILEERGPKHIQIIFGPKIYLYLYFFLFRMRRGPAPLDECEIHLISLEFRGFPMGFMGLRLKYNPSPFSHNFKTHKIKMK